MLNHLFMAVTGADILVQTLIDWGVEILFGLPGDGIDGIMESLRTHQKQIRFIHVRHEESAAFMACAYAKYTGRLGVCLGTSGPGGIHLLNGLYDAKLDGVPVLAITGHHFHDLIDTFAQQDVDLDRVFMDVAAYSARVMGPDHVANVTNLACRTALSRRTVAHINFPIDFQDMPVKKAHPSKRNVECHNAEFLARRAALPAAEDVQRAADVLNQGSKIAILAGRGALNATDELIALSEQLGAPIIKPLLGKACVPDDDPHTTGGIGLLGTTPSHEAIENCDTLLMIGTSFPYIEFLPKPGQARGVQIDLDPTRIGLRYPVEVGLVGDSRNTIRLLMPLLRFHEDRSFLQEAQEGTRDWWKLMETRGTRRDKPMKPQVVAWELSKLLSDDAIVSCDSGTIATWFARQLRARRGQMYSLSGTLATMANGLPYAIAAQIAYPHRQSVAFIGDGGFSMLMAEFSTAVKYQLPIKVFVLKNNVLGMIRWEQMVILGNPEYGIELQPIDFAMFARACGGIGLTITEPAACGHIIDEALHAPGPVLVEAVVDPYEPPLPPKIKPEQALKFAESLARGEPRRMRIARTVLKDKIREMV
jgi:pyruvate dehydrogenase (quinone)